MEQSARTALRRLSSEKVVITKFIGAGMSLAESLANARLIAAAPDMLDALKRVLAVADRKTDEFDAARAAIAKAEARDV